MSTGQAYWAHKDRIYLELCDRYGEEPQYSAGARGLKFLESTGFHAESLKSKAYEFKRLLKRFKEVTNE